MLVALSYKEAYIDLKDYPSLDILIGDMVVYLNTMDNVGLQLQVEVISACQAMHKIYKLRDKEKSIPAGDLKKVLAMSDDHYLR